MALGPHQFETLLENLASAWEEQKPAIAARLFTQDAVYMEPPSIQLFQGDAELLRYFGAVQPGTRMRWWRIWFDAESQSGVGEYTFGRLDGHEAVHGVAVIDVRDGLISRWSEYQRSGPADRSRFLATEDKEWDWHAGNYP